MTLKMGESNIIHEINADNRKKIVRFLNVPERTVFEKDNLKEG